MTDNKEIDDLFNDDNVPESNWFKMENVGDKVHGEVVEIIEQPAKGDYAPQRVFSLKQKDGSVIKYGVKYPMMKNGVMQGSDYLITRSNKVQLGDLVGFEFKKEIPPRVKGHHPAKSIEIYVKKGVKPVPVDDGFGGQQ